MSAPHESHRRLRKEYQNIHKNPPPYITAEPLPSNLLEWHYCLEGAPNTPYHGGFYHGKIIFPSDYPFKPPQIQMVTPNGRFKCNTRLCLSMSDFHPDTWNPSWSVETILTGLLSFMSEDTDTAGSIRSSDATKRRFARESISFNLRSSLFRDLFPFVTERLELMQDQSAPEPIASGPYGAPMGSASDLTLFSSVVALMALVIAMVYWLIVSP